MAEEYSERDRLFEELIRANQEQLYRFIFTICPDQNVVEDIVQETNRVIWEKREQFELETDFQAWTRRIAKFQTLYFFNKSKRKSWLHFDSDLVNSLANACEHSSNLQVALQKAVLTECLEKLDKSELNLIELRYAEQRKLIEIGHLTERTEGAVKQVLLRIRNKLKNCVQSRMNRVN